MNFPFPEIPITPKRPPKHLLSLEEAEERLNPYKELLEDCIQQGWDAWNTHYAHRHYVLDARARAAIVFSEIVARAKEKFANLPDVRFKQCSNSFLLYIGNDIVLRFKKIRKNGRCSSISTRQQVLFAAQMTLPAQMKLPGMEAGTMLHAGYALDDLQREIERKLVVCQFKNRVLWTISLTTDGGNIEIMPSGPLAPPQRPKSPRWESKADKNEQKPKIKAITAGKE